MWCASVHEVAPNSAAAGKVSRRHQPNFGRRAGASRIWFAQAGKVAAARLRGLLDAHTKNVYKFTAQGGNTDSEISQHSAQNMDDIARLFDSMLATFTPPGRPCGGTKYLYVWDTDDKKGRLITSIYIYIYLSLSLCD